MKAILERMTKSKKVAEEMMVKRGIMTTMRAPTANQRPWRDIERWRLMLGIAVAPVAPVVLGSCLLLALSDGGIIYNSLAGVLAAADAWSLAVGGGILLLLGRIRGVIRRADCLLLGAFLAFSLPLAAVFISHAVDWINGAQQPPEDTDLMLDEGSSGGNALSFIGLCLIPFGTLGGWIFWWVGVHPAKPKTLDASSVFD